MYLYLCVLLIVTTTKGSTYPIDINISPEVIHLNSAVTVTCTAIGNDNGVLTLIPYNIINGTYLPYTCVDSYEPSERFSGLQYYFTYLPDVVTFTTKVSINPIALLDDGLTLACVFYDLQLQTYYNSSTINVNIFIPTTTVQSTIIYSSSTPDANISSFTTTVPSAINLFTTPQDISDNFVNSQDFYITVGTFSVVVFGSIVMIFILLAILIVCAFTRRRVAKHSIVKDCNMPTRCPHEG